MSNRPTCACRAGTSCRDARGHRPRSTLRCRSSVWFFCVASPTSFAVAIKTEPVSCSADPLVTCKLNFRFHLLTRDAFSGSTIDAHPVCVCCAPLRLLESMARHLLLADHARLFYIPPIALLASPLLFPLRPHRFSKRCLRLLEATNVTTVSSEARAADLVVSDVGPC